ncbi:MAG: methionine--tRNA ligase [Patescibacteria group bacterium]
MTDTNFYITTTLPYVNADPHLGFATEIVLADILARHWRVRGRAVFFNTGTDEHGLKIFRQAVAAGLSPQAYVNHYAESFRRLRSALNLSYDNFIRTTDEAHVVAAQEFWRRVAAAGHIYKKLYPIKYCVGCELEKTDSELEAGRCPLHPAQEIEVREEENYFFKFSSFQKQLLDWYNHTVDFVIPERRFGEIKNFVANGLQDFSVSRLRSKMPWGVPVPDDPEQVMYVWFDALVNYISAIGWPTDMAKFGEWWPVVQLAGKDNLRQQAAMWQAMLAAAGLPFSRQVVIHGFITSSGQKMSKSLGNVIDPLVLVNDFGTDAVRYFLARHVHPFEDSDVTREKFAEAYNANLANGLGNLVSRLMRMTIDYGVRLPAESQKQFVFSEEEQKFLERYEVNRVLDKIWARVGELDLKIQTTQPFVLIKTDPERAKKDVAWCVGELWQIASALEPFLPATAATVQQAISSHAMPPPLFPRK